MAIGRIPTTTNGLLETQTDVSDFKIIETGVPSQEIKANKEGLEQVEL